MRLSKFRLFALAFAFLALAPLALPDLAMAQATPTCTANTMAGGDPTGKTPSDAALMAAFSTSNAANKTCIPCGNYLVNAAHLVVPADGFEVYSPQQCAVLVMGPAYSGMLISTNGKLNAKIHDLRIVGSGSTASNTAIEVRPNAQGKSDATLDHLYIHNVSIAVRAGVAPWGGNVYPTSGITITNSDIGDTLSYAVIVNDVSNFTFTGNTLSNWYKTIGTDGGDGINFDMKADIANWKVDNNVFISGPGGSHAISQGPLNYQFIIKGASFSNNKSSSTVAGIAGKGMGFGIECSDCVVANNTFSNPLNSGSGWRNCLEVYPVNNVKITNNSCDNGVLQVGPIYDGANIDNLEISNNTIKTKGKLGTNTMSCINFSGVAGYGANGPQSQVSNVNIVNNTCDATLSGTGYGVLGIVINKPTNAAANSYTWSKITNLTISGNTINQPAINQAIRFVSPSISAANVTISDNKTPQGLAFTGTTGGIYGNTNVKGNDFHLVTPAPPIQGITFTNNTYK